MDNISGNANNWYKEDTLKKPKKVDEIKTQLSSFHKKQEIKKILKNISEIEKSINLLYKDKSHKNLYDASVLNKNLLNLIKEFSQN